MSFTENKKTENKEVTTTQKSQEFSNTDVPSIFDSAMNRLDDFVDPMPIVDVVASPKPHPTTPTTETSPLHSSEETSIPNTTVDAVESPALPQINATNEPKPLPTAEDMEDDTTKELTQYFLQSAPMEERVIEAISEVYDPEIPVNIYELGLIYEVRVEEGNAVKIQMTLTSPACPVAGTLPGEVEQVVLKVPEVESVEVELVWDPPWSFELMSEAAQLQLGFF